ncbi:pyridoxine 5'-phosphate synthase [Dissulfuribacter thermophilus]
MAELCVNVDHVATIRQARGGDEPDPVVAANIVELAGADGVVVHLREDRRHIQDRDLRLIRQIVSTRLTLEMAATEEMLRIAEEVRPDVVTLVPERREEITTEGGLDVVGLEDKIRTAVQRLNDAGIPVTLFVDPEEAQIEATSRVGAQAIEIHTGRYAEAKTEEEIDREFESIVRSARIGADLGLKVNVGHGLNYKNVVRLTAIPEIEEFSIGHSIISRAVMVGLERAVRDMIALIKQGFLV